MDIREKIARELAFQTLQDEKLITKSNAWVWVVKEGFVDEWLGKADQILAIVAEEFRIVIRGKYPQGNTYSDQMERVVDLLNKLEA